MVKVGNVHPRRTLHDRTLLFSWKQRKKPLAAKTQLEIGYSCLKTFKDKNTMERQSCERQRNTNSFVKNRFFCLIEEGIIQTEGKKSRILERNDSIQKIIILKEDRKSPPKIKRSLDMMVLFSLSSLNFLAVLQFKNTQSLILRIQINELFPKQNDIIQRLVF